MKAALLAIGDEIVAGLTTDTNSAFLAQLLRAAGVDVTGFLTIPDDEPDIRAALTRALQDADVVVTTGGLGPTADDLTTATVASLAGAPLELHEPSLAAIEDRFRALGIPMPANNRKQAMLPLGSTVIPNPDGTAPGFGLTLERPDGERLIVCLPGVPREMRRMAEESVQPWIARLAGKGVIRSRVYSTVGLSESRMDELLVGTVDPSEARLSFRAAFPRLQCRITATGPSEAEVEARLERLEGVIRERLGHHLYAVGDEGLEQTVGTLLRAASATIAVAESCTGGLIGHRLTDVPGSSDYFRVGVIAYSNEAKRTLLGVSGSTLESFGAVSEETVREMAKGVRALAGATIGVATSGIAGPGGGSPEKPVGTVCIALASEAGEWSRRYQLAPRSRTWVKEMAAQVALDRVRRHLAGLDG